MPAFSLFAHAVRIRTRKKVKCPFENREMERGVAEMAFFPFVVIILLLPEIEFW